MPNLHGYRDSEPSSETALEGQAGLTQEWLNEVLSDHLHGATVTELALAPVGTGQVSDSVRLTVGYDRQVELPTSFVAKVPSSSETSRAGARTVRTYEVEARFYAHLRPDLLANVPRCFHVAHDPVTDHYAVLLEDLRPAAQGDQLTGVDPDSAAAAIDEMTRLHSSFWGDESLAGVDWLNRHPADADDFIAEMLGSLFEGFAERYAERLEPAALSLVASFRPLLRDYLAIRVHPSTIAHSDFRADNLLFGGPRVAVLDWQTVSYGPGPADLAYFLGSSLTVDDRRVHEERLVRHYHQGLVGSGVDFTWDQCWLSYRRHAFQGILVAVAASMMVEQTARGDDMFVTMASRHAAHAIDLESLELLA
jgi:hypothetical protein